MGTEGTHLYGDRAPHNLQYVVLVASSNLTQERVLTGTANQITVTDNGAGSTVVLSLPSALTIPGTLDSSYTNTVAGGDSLINVHIIQGDDDALTGTLRGAYITASNGDEVATGTIRGVEIKARAGYPGETGANVNVLEGFSISSDAKTYDVTTHRGGEIILDGGAGTSTLAVGLRIANNFQANRATTSYGLQIYRDSFDYTADIQLSSGGLIGGVSGHILVDSSGNVAINEAGADVDTRIESSGNANMLFVDGANNRVGVGTNTPVTTLDVSAPGTASVTIRSTASGGAASMEFGTGGSGNRYALFDLTGDDTYTDYALRIIRSNTGANAASYFMHRGTGNFLFYTLEAAAISFYTNNTSRWSIASDGNLLPVGAGTLDIGSAAVYPNEINYKEITDRGCLGWYEDGIELRDGRIVGDVEALKSIKKHKTLKTGAGVPRLDYETMPKDVYKAAPRAEEDIYKEEHRILKNDPITNLPRYEIIRTLRHKKGEKAGDDGAELSALISIIIGAIKELNGRLEVLE